jgi:hypothetical protein
MKFDEVAALLNSKGVEGAIHELFSLLADLIALVEEIKHQQQTPPAKAKEK